MRHSSAWALSLALLVGVAGVAAAQDPAPTQSASQNNGGLFGWMNFGQPAPKKTTATPAKTQPVVESATVQRNREKAAFYRRVAVCDKLKDLAIATRDADLERRVDQLRDQVYETYMRHMALLPVETNADERGLASQLSPNDSAGRLTGGTTQRPTGSAISQGPTREDER